MNKLIFAEITGFMWKIKLGQLKILRGIYLELLNTKYSFLFDTVGAL